MNGLAEFETLYPLAQALSARERVTPHVFITSKMAQLDPRILPLLEATGGPVTIQSRFRLKWLYHRLLNRIDAVLTLTDPAADQTGRARRSRAIMHKGLPTIFLQHGVLQDGLNRFKVRPAAPFYARLVLAFEPLDELAGRIPPAELAKIQPIGYLKKACIPLRPPSIEFNTWRARYRHIVLLCHSFRWKDRYEADEAEAFYQMVASSAASMPETGFIIRPHRGLGGAAYDHLDVGISAKHANVILSEAHSGLLAGLAMHDVLAVVDAAVSPGSTAILDAVYAGKQTGVYRNDSDKFQSLESITDAASLVAFVGSIGRPLTGEALLANHFGKVEDNIQNAAAMIEQNLLAHLQFLA
jgi:hypothetical protein